MESSPPTEAAAGPTTSGWADNKRAALAVRTAVLLAPLVVVLIATWAATRIWEAPDSGFDALMRFVVLAAFALALGAGTEAIARRALPLAALLRLSLVFPDEAPSRFAIALRSGSTRSLEKRLTELDSEDFGGSEADAARIIVELAAALSRHDRLTKGHSERVRAYTALIAEEMELSDHDVNKLQWAGLIHDVGKLKVPYEILTKPGKLNDREWAIIKTHPTVGMQLAAPLADFLGPWIHAIGDHHERVDGAGYPRGLRGEEISLGGRIVAVADAYDMMTAARSYQTPRSAKLAREELARCAGTQFDPQVVRAFLNVGLGTVRRSMWPLSWVVQVPFIGVAVTAPVTQAVTASVLTLATATGVTAATGGLEPIDVPAAIAFVQSATTEEADSEGTASAPATTAFAIPTTTQQRDIRPGATPTDTSTTAPPAESTTTRPVAPNTTIRVGTTLAPTTTTTVLETTTTKRASATTDVVTTVPVETTTSAAPATTTTTTTTVDVAPADDCVRAQDGDTQLAGADLRNCVLTELDLSNTVLDGANFAGAELTDVSFINSSLVGADFSGATLTDVAFDGGTLTGARFRQALIAESRFISATLTEADFTGADLSNGSMFDAHLDRASFTNVEFSSWSLKETSVRSATFDGASFGDTLLKYADADGASFVGAHLEGVWIYGSSFVEADFTSATGTPLGHEDAEFDGALCPNGEPTSTSCW